MAKLPADLIRKYGVSKKAWKVFRNRNAGKRVKKVRRKASTRRGRGSSAKRSAGAGPRRTHRTVNKMVRRKGRKSGGRKHGIPSLATIAVTVHALRELGILDMALNSLGAGANIVDEAKTWAQNFQAGSLVDAAIPAVVLMFFRKVAPKGPRLGPINLW